MRDLGRRITHMGYGPYFHWASVLQINDLTAWPAPHEMSAPAQQCSSYTPLDQQPDSPLPPSSGRTSPPSRSRLHAPPETHRMATIARSGTSTHNPARSPDMQHFPPAYT